MKQFKLVTILFFTFLFCLPFQLRIIYQTPETYIGSVFSYTQALMLYGTDILFVAVLVSYFLSVRTAGKLNRNIVSSLFLLVIWLALSLFHVKQTYLPIYQILKWVELLTIVILSPKILSNKNELQAGLLILYLSALFQALIGIIQFHVQHSLGLSFLGEYIAPLGTSGLATIDLASEKLIRAYGTFPHPNIFAAYLLLGLSIGLYVVSRETETLLNKIFVSCGTILIALGIFFSFSRLAWFLTAGIGMFYVSLQFSKMAYTKAIWIIAILFVSCGTIVFTNPSLINYGAELNTQSKSVILRESFNNMGLDLIKEKPLTGVGLGNYVSAMKQKFSLADWEYQPAHNIFIFIAAEIGLVGLVLFSNFLWQVFRSTWNTETSQEKELLLAIFISFLILSMFDHYFVTIQQGRLMFFSLLGLMVSYSQLNKNNVAQR